MHNGKNINPLCGYIYCNNLKHLNKNLFDNPYVDKLDIVYYSFIHVEEDGTVTMPSTFLDSLEQVVNLRFKNVKPLVSINGAKGMSISCNNEVLRNKLVKSLVNFITENNFSGVDIDWEVPGSNELSIEVDKANLNSFVKELKTSLLDKDPNYLLTMAVHGTPLGDNRYDYGYLNEYIDFYNVMSYDANLDDVTSHLCPLYKNEIDSRNYSIDEAYHKLIKKIPNEKIILSAAFYGKAYQIDEDIENDLVIGKKAHYIQSEYQSGTCHYFYIKSHYNKEKGFEVFFDSKTKSTYAYNYKTKVFVTYDDPISLKAKIEYIKTKKVGLMFWDYGGDNDSELISVIIDNTKGEEYDKERKI